MTRVALVEYYVDHRGTLIFLVKPSLTAPLVFEAGSDPDGHAMTAERLRCYATRLLIDFHGLPPGWDTGPITDRYRVALSLPPSVNAAKRGAAVLERKLSNPAFCYEMTYWERLALALIPPGLRCHLGDCDLLCIVPHGPLHALPFSALRWTSDKYLSERFGLCHLPAASLLPYCRLKHHSRADAQGQRPSRRCFVAAVAASEDPHPGDLESDAVEFAELFARQVGPTHSYVGATGEQPASKNLVRDSVDGHDVVHLACHGIFGGDPDPMGNSGLLLSDGDTAPSLTEFFSQRPVERLNHLLSAREILGLRIDADLVTLRACSSGRSEVTVGDELLGLIRAFFYAGTASVIASLWNVNKLSSRALMKAFYESWLADGGHSAPKWQALQDAQAQIRAVPEYTHPYHWAPFILLGDWL